MNPTEENSQERQMLILVVDDNTEFLNGIKLTLEMEGYKVWTAMNGEEALEQLRAIFLKQDDHKDVDAQLPDLILADIMMPVMDGYEFYEHVHNNPYLHRIPFIFLTAKGEAEDIRHGKELGSDDYLPKMSSPEDILATIRGKLRRAEQQRFFDLMSQRAAERQQDALAAESSSSKLLNNSALLVLLAIIAILVVIAIIVFVQQSTLL